MITLPDIEPHVEMDDKILDLLRQGPAEASALLELGEGVGPRLGVLLCDGKIEVRRDLWQIIDAKPKKTSKKSKTDPVVAFDDIKHAVLVRLDTQGDIQAQGLYDWFAEHLTYRGLCRVLRQLEADGTALCHVDGGVTYWRSMACHKRREAEHRAFLERMERERLEQEAREEEEALEALRAGEIRASDLRAKHLSMMERFRADRRLGALKRLAEKGLASYLRGVYRSRLLMDCLATDDLETTTATTTATPAFNAAPRHEKMLARLREAGGQITNPDSSSWRGTLCDLERAGLVLRRYEKCIGGQRTVWALVDQAATAEASPELADVIASEPDLAAIQALIDERAQEEPQESLPPKSEAPQELLAEACDWIRSLLETSGDKSEVLPSWDRWRAHQSLPAPLEAALGLALRYRVAHQLHAASPQGDRREQIRRGQALWDATFKALDLAAALVAAPLDEDDPQRVREESAKRREEMRQYLIAAHTPDPQEDQAPQDTLALGDLLTPSPPVLKRCASTARGQTCGAEAHTEEEVERLFGWRWITSDTDHPRKIPQGQCKACKSALNKIHAKARRSPPAAPDLRQADLLQELPPPPARPDHFARLRAVTALVVDGQHIGEGITTSRPPKLSPNNPERLVVACEAGALRLALSPLGEWTVKAEEHPKATVAQLAVWARAAAVVSVALEIDAHTHISDGPGLSGLEWTRLIKAARDNTPLQSDNIRPDKWQPSDNPAGDGADKSVTTGPLGVTSGRQLLATVTALSPLVTGCHSADQLGGEP